MKRVLPVALVVGLFLAQAGGPGAAADGPANDRELLMQLDRDFDAATAERGAEGWVSYFAEHGSMLRVDGPPTTGHTAIREVMSGVFARPEFSLRWQPTKGEILIPGALGYTVGRYERKVRREDGKLDIEHGTYFTLWRKQTDGSWKVLADTGEPDTPPQVGK